MAGFSSWRLKRNRICTWKAVFYFVILLALVLALLHFYLLPSWSGAYNKDCYLSTDDKNDLIYLLKGLIQEFQAHKITYWLDYGTLLGAIRYGGVIPWDGDGDVSIIHPGDKYDATSWIDDLARRGIGANMMIARYGNMQVDIMRWKRFYVIENDKNVTYLYKYYPASTKDSFAVRMHHKLESFPEDWIEPRKSVDFNGTKAHVPCKWKELLAKRYPMSLSFTFPYKWKCWVPTWMT
eukprot:gene7581-8420_t